MILLLLLSYFKKPIWFAQVTFTHHISCILYLYFSTQIKRFGSRLERFELNEHTGYIVYRLFIKLVHKIRQTI